MTSTIFSTSTSLITPTDLIGRWTTADARYADRAFEITPETFYLGQGDGLFVSYEILQIRLEELRRGGAASPEQLRLIEEAGGAALEAGGVDIERFRTESLDALRNELAPSLGLRPSDTPILDRGGRVAAEATRQGGQLSSRIRQAQASANARTFLPTAWGSFWAIEANLSEESLSPHFWVVRIYGPRWSQRPGILAIWKSRSQMQLKPSAEVEERFSAGGTKALQ